MKYSLVFAIISVLANSAFGNTSCIIKIENLAAEKLELSFSEQSSWRDAKAEAKHPQNEAFVAKIEKELRALVIDGQSRTALSFLKEGRVLDSIKKLRLSDFGLPEMMDFIATYNTYKQSKNPVSAEQLLQLATQIEQNTFLSPTYVLTTRPLTKEQEIQYLLAGKLFVQIGSHQLTVRSLEKNLAFIKNMRNELDHMADTTLAGASDFNQLSGHMELELKKSQDLAASLIFKAKNLAATHPGLAAAIVSMLHSHVVNGGKVLKLMQATFFDQMQVEEMEISTQRKGKSKQRKILRVNTNEFVLFPIGKSLQEYTQNTPHQSGEAKLHDFIIARAWLVQELTLNERN